MRCEKAQEIFSDYLEGTLERPMAFTLEHHLGECPTCGRDYEHFRETWQMLDTFPAVEVPLGLRESVIDKLREQQAVRRKPIWSFDFSNLFQTRVMIRTAAACAAVALFGVMTFKVMTPQQSPVDPTINSDVFSRDVPKPTLIGPDNNYNVWIGESTAPIADPGMQITVKVLPLKGERVLYKIDLKHSDGPEVTAKAYLMDQGSPVVNARALDSASLLINETLKKDQESTISVVTDRNSNGDVVYIKWDHNSKSASEVVFLPGNLTADVTFAPFAVSDMTIHEAIQKLSSTYGVVVMTDASITGKVGQVNVEYGSVDEAAYWMLKAYSGDKVLNWKAVKHPNIFKVEQK